MGRFLSRPGRATGRGRTAGTVVVAVLLACATLAAAGGEDDGSFGMTEPVACKDIRGYEDYDPLPSAALTSDEKMLVYFRPLHFKTARKGDEYQAHFTQDGRIRRRGRKEVLWSKKNLLDYTARSSTGPPSRISLRNTIALKGLKPGEYALDIVLRDEIGKSAPVVRTLRFTVLPSPPGPKAEEPGVADPRGSGGLDRPPR